MKHLLPLFLLCSLAPAATLDFTRDVHPILAEHCFACHGGDKRSGGLSLRDYSEIMKGGKDGPVILPGHSADSFLIHRVTATTSFMPPVGPRLTEKEIATLRAWIDDGARETAQSSAAKMPWIAKLELTKPEIPPAAPGASEHPVDRFVAAYLRAHKLTVPAPADDRTFARRAYLDIWGLLPMPDQLAAFLNDKAPDKRERLIATLLADNRNYAENWISFWNDLLRNDEGVNYAGTRKSITSWLYGSLENNLAYDKFVEKLLDPAGPRDPDGFLLGVNWRGDVNASQLPNIQAAQNTAQVFLGINLKCNSCHDSFISKWKLRDAYGLAAYFSDANQLELVRCDNKTGVFTGAKFLYPELDVPNPPAAPAERKAAVSRMFTDPRNGRTPRTIVNRIWARLFGYGIVEDVDDMDGEPWNPELLDWLATDFVEHGWDLKHLISTIMTSQAYQLPAVRRSEKTIHNYAFRGPEVRRLTAEEFADALSALTGEWPIYVPAQTHRGVYSREWRTPSSLLTRSLGRPIRDQVFTERNQDATTLQALELVNGEVLMHRLARGSKRMLGQLPPSPANLYDSGRLVAGKAVNVDIDISNVRELRLLTVDQGSYSPERVMPGWIHAVLVGPDGETPLSSLPPASGQATRGELLLTGDTRPDALLTSLPSELVYNIAGRGYTRLKASVALDDRCKKDDINAAVRFFVFEEKPDPERLVQVDEKTPVPAIHGPFTADSLISAVFQYMLDRPPSLEERKCAAAALTARGSRQIPADGLADLLWAIAMQPEFQLID